MKKKTKFFVGAIAGLAILAGFAYGFGLFGGPSDKELIKVALNDAIEASKEGRPGGVLELISQRFEINGAKYGTGDIARVIKEQKPDVTVQKPDPVVEGDAATITSPVRLSVFTMGVNISEVKITFARELGTKWLIFPTKKWRMVHVEVPESVVQEVSGQMGGLSQL